LATDFFVLDLNWQRRHKLFPLDFSDIWAKFNEIKLFFTGNVLYLEDALAFAYTSLFLKEHPEPGGYKKALLNSIYHLKEREPIHYRQASGVWARTMEWPELGLYTYHDEDVLKKKNVLCLNQELSGTYIEKLRQADNLSYFNKI
jgi:hypothetical protein